MVKFVGIDTQSRQITLVFDYDIKDDEKVIKYAKQRLGEDVDIDSFSFIEELGY